MKQIVKIGAATFLFLGMVGVANAGLFDFLQPKKPVGVPEPATLGLLGIGIVAAAAAARRRKK